MDKEKKEQVKKIMEGFEDKWTNGEWYHKKPKDRYYTVEVAKIKAYFEKEIYKLFKRR